MVIHVKYVTDCSQTIAPDIHSYGLAPSNTGSREWKLLRTSFGEQATVIGMSKGQVFTYGHIAELMADRPQQGH